MTATKPTPDIPLPPGAHTWTGWESDDDGVHRIIWGEAHTVDGTNLSVSPHATQLADGSINPNRDHLDVSAGIAVDEIRHDNKLGVPRVYDCIFVSVKGARELAAALLDAADEIDGWARQ